MFRPFKQAAALASATFWTLVAPCELNLLDKFGTRGARAISEGPQAAFLSPSLGSPCDSSLPVDLMASTESLLLKATASDLQALLRAGQLTSVKLVEMCLAQIAAYDRRGPNLRAIISTSEQALSSAAELDRERANGNIRGPFHGIPIVVKDVINTGPSLDMCTTLGSYAFEEARAKKDADVIGKLRKKGLIILGKANLTELGNWKGDNLTSGWSALGGQTQSAYVRGGVEKREMRLGHSAPGGSSSGSAVAVSAGYSPLSLGTELDGSTVTPASRSALYGLKPSNGAVTMDGIFVVSDYFDVVGSMAKSVEDLATLVEHTLDSTPRSRLPDNGYQPFLTKAWEGLKVGFVNPDDWRLPETLVKPNADVLAQTKRSIELVVEKIEELGGTIRYPVEVRHPSTFGSSMRTVIVSESQTVIKRYLATLDDAPQTVQDIIAFNKNHAHLELPEDYPNQALLLSTANEDISESDYQAAKEHIKQAALDALDALNRYDIDVIIAPMDSPIASIAACAGGPIGTAPLGRLGINGRAFGLGLIARPGDEAAIFRVMSAFEATFPPRELPPLLAGETGAEDQSVL